MNFVIDLKVYPFDVMVSVGESDEQLFKKLKAYDIGEDECEMAKYENTGIGRYCLFECGASLLRLKTKPVKPDDRGTLAHEIFHITTAIMWKIGMKLEIGTSDEAYAYLNDYLTAEIYKLLK